MIKLAPSFNLLSVLAGTINLNIYSPFLRWLEHLPILAIISTNSLNFIFAVLWQWLKVRVCCHCALAIINWFVCKEWNSGESGQNDERAKRRKDREAEAKAHIFFININSSAIISSENFTINQLIFCISDRNAKSEYKHKIDIKLFVSVGPNQLPFLLSTSNCIRRDYRIEPVDKYGVDRLAIQIASKKKINTLAYVNCGE